MSLLDVLQVHEEALSRAHETPLVMHVHAHERRDMELLVQFEALYTPLALCRPGAQQVAVLFAPGCVVDLGDDVFDDFTAGIETVVKAHRVEAMSEIAQLGEQSHRSLRTLPAALFDQVADAVRQWLLRVAEVIGTAKPGQVRPSR